jgi:hypothetical protein
VGKGKPPGGEGPPWRLKRHGRVRRERRQVCQFYTSTILLIFNQPDLRRQDLEEIPV